MSRNPFRQPSREYERSRGNFSGQPCALSICWDSTAFVRSKVRAWAALLHPNVVLTAQEKNRLMRSVADFVKRHDLKPPVGYEARKHYMWVFLEHEDEWKDWVAASQTAEDADYYVRNNVAYLSFERATSTEGLGGRAGKVYGRTKGRGSDALWRYLRTVLPLAPIRQ